VKSGFSSTSENLLRGGWLSSLMRTRADAADGSRAARFALAEYRRCSAYICLPHRSFRPCVRMAFYTKNKIDRRTPKILERIEAISNDSTSGSGRGTAFTRGQRYVSLAHLFPRTRAASMIFNLPEVIGHVPYHRGKIESCSLRD
jgi:hypothetical protein